MHNIISQITRAELYTLIVTTFSAIVSLVCLICLLASIYDSCKRIFFVYYFFYYTCGALQTILQHKMQKMDLFDKQRRKTVERYLAILFVPVFLNLYLATMWWTRSDKNPMYCMFGTQLKLPYIFGLALEIHGMIGVVLFVGTLRAYTTRKYFLISIGGPQNQIIRNDIVPALLQMPIIRLNNANLGYANFVQEKHNQPLPKINEIRYEGNNQISIKFKENQCSICLQILKQTQVATIQCGHLFHSKCLQGWIDNKQSPLHLTCPVCRTAIR